ncbi:HET-domain-containing protein [Xylaria grammica]|nr:HET-domain-containing protein [Xylaria grammica]
MESSAPIYRPLEEATKSIRVLELLPGTFENDLRGVLRTVVLENRPSYEALSYTWGARTEGRTLKIQNQWVSKSNELPITDNLFRALKRLRRLFKPRVLWVDAVCINQEDLDERSAQVALMADIYSSAESTTIWLGDVEGTNIHEPSLSSGHRKWQLASSVLPLRLLWNGDCFPMDHAIQTTTPSWKDRGWIIQEYALSRRLYFQFGSQRRMIGEPSPYGGQMGGAIPDSGLVLEKKIQFPGLVGLDVRLQRLDRIRVEMESGKLMSLYHATLAVRESATTDPRDKVYSLLSFLNPVERSLIHPDYLISTELCFSRATYAVLQGPTKFAMLELINFDTSRPSATIPTWVYDFRASDPFSRHHLDDELTKTSIPLLEMNAESTELIFEGVCADVVMAVSTSLTGYRESCWKHSGHDIDTDDCVVARVARQIVELVQQTERLIRREAATELSDYGIDCDSMEATKSRRESIVNRIFTTNDSWVNERAVYSLFEHWETITADLGIPRPNKLPSSQSLDTLGETNFNAWSKPTNDQTHAYCQQASGSTVLFTTMSGNLGIAPGTVKEGDKLVLPLYKTASGEIDAQVVPFNQPLALILRGQDGDRWTFHGLAHLDGLGDKAQYIKHSKHYVIR